ncbi:hypothetical protein ANOM_011535 [Aspergillus nomiae NRRL 13137]|uniref:Major facilitator superfamily (MFS) profile domain-containing protein n=1 Tax=Aspergillus nomiae NRRL (strain ATCC 15546 / NRRL 13137 / CBS 260.88 / M93) TaxID=1509407 RepID=A0A0L1INM6_ASPN3|nr:uncharacterized protein ANOM_011535 [Aspergillus nomiae NRRL 13137]KNG81132.1 hypothetical protein ANOM_011535 [Aspergillus nomiae NRRL 13137]
MGQIQTPTASSSSEHTFRAWLTVIGAFFTFFCSVGFINAFGVFQDYYQSHQLSSYSSFDISWIGSFSTFALFSGAPIAGVLVDRVGPTVLLIFGGLAMLVAVFMTSLCQQYYQFFLAQAVLLGARLAMGVTVGGSSAGGVVWPIVLNELLNKDGVTFGWTIRIVGFIMLPLLVLAVLTVTPPAKKANDDHHHHMLTDEEERNKRHEVDGTHEILQEEANAHKQGLLSLLKNTTFMVLCLGLSISYLGMFSPFFYATSYAESLGHSTSFAFYLVSIINAASLFGRILPGILADRYGHFNLCGTAALLSGATALCWTAAKSSGGLVVWCLAYGLTSGAIMSLQSACAAHLAPHELHGTAVGLLMGSVALTALFGTPISGQLVESYGYLALSMYAGASLVVGSILIFVARFKMERRVFARQ